MEAPWLASFQAGLAADDLAVGVDVKRRVRLRERGAKRVDVGLLLRCTDALEHRHAKVAKAMKDGALGV